VFSGVDSFRGFGESRVGFELALGAIIGLRTSGCENVSILIFIMRPMIYDRAPVDKAFCMSFNTSAATSSDVLLEVKRHN